MLSILVMLFSIFSSNPATVYNERVYTIKKPLKAIVENLINDSHGTGDITIPDIVKKAPICITTQFQPYQGYYKICLTLDHQYDKLVSACKTLELWSKEDSTIVKSTIQLEAKTNYFPLRWINPIKRKVLEKIEQKVLDIEEDALKSLGD